MCRALALNLPRRLKKRVPAWVKQPLAVPEAAKGCWSLDCTSDVLTEGRCFRTLHVFDDDNRERLGVEMACSLPASRLVQVLTRLVDCHVYPTGKRTGPQNSNLLTLLPYENEALNSSGDKPVFVLKSLLNDWRCSNPN